MKMFPITYAPDMDTSWAVNPGYLTDINGLFPMQSGRFVTHVDIDYSWLKSTGNGPTAGYVFPQTSGAVRMVVFEDTDINEYSSTGVRTNLASGLTFGSWNAAAWGNQIIAVSRNIATKTSSGAGVAFTSLSGAPKAQFIASNSNFVMLADVDDGGSNNYTDMVWNSGFRDPSTWTPAIRTQASRSRLPEGGGGITGLVAYRDTFIAFKKDGMWSGTYVGPQQGIFQWRPISRKIGCSYGGSIAECDGKLYFCHTSGFYSYDGQTLTNISREMWQTYLAQEGYISDSGWGGIGAPPGGITYYALRPDAAVDDIEGTVAWLTSYTSVSYYYSHFIWVFNTRSGKWGKTVVPGTGEAANTDISQKVMLRGSSADIASSGIAGRFAYLAGRKITSLSYPNVATHGPVSLTTGLIGDYDRSTTKTRFSWRTLQGTTANSASTATVTGYPDEALSSTTHTTTAVVNNELNCADFVANGRFYKVALSFNTSSNQVILAGLGVGPTSR